VSAGQDSLRFDDPRNDSPGVSCHVDKIVGVRFLM
jgi:hypothetical protein